MWDTHNYAQVLLLALCSGITIWGSEDQTWAGFMQIDNYSITLTLAAYREQRDQCQLPLSDSNIHPAEDCASRSVATLRACFHEEGGHKMGRCDSK